MVIKNQTDRRPGADIRRSLFSFPFFLPSIPSKMDQLQKTCFCIGDSMVFTYIKSWKLLGITYFAWFGFKTLYISFYIYSFFSKYKVYEKKYEKYEKMKENKDLSLKKVCYEYAMEFNSMQYR
jgi:hypothetical protein